MADKAVELVRYDAACQALAAAKSTDDVKDIRDKAEAMRAYARQANNKQMEVDAAEIRIRAERRLGELIANQKDTMGLAKGGKPYQSKPTGVKDTPVETLADAGIDKNLAKRARKLAAIPEERFEEQVVDWREKESAKLSAFGDGPHVSHNSGVNEWYTPVRYIEAARRAMGRIDFDPASSIEANKRVKAGRFCTIDDDGLSVAWTGRVWMNPPYANNLVSRFVEKLISELEEGNVSVAVALVNNGTETVWCQKLISSADGLCFPAGRISFMSPDGGKNQPLQGQIIAGFGCAGNEFKLAFEDIGVCI